MNFIGVDPSLKETGFVILDDKSNIIHQDLIITKPVDGEIYTRITKIHNTLYKFAKADKQNIWYIEGLSHNSKGRAILDIAGVHHVITVMLFRHFVNFKEIPPRSLKMWVGGKGKGNAKKDLMLLFVYKRWGIEFHNHNLADAYALARMAYEERNKNAG